jgi:nitrogen fixation protein NifU and related proteins
MNEYQEQLLENYHNPKNFGEPIFKPTHKTKVSNPVCGDELELWLKVNNEVIEDLSFKGEGCSISIATASMVYDLIKGKDLAFVSSLSQSFVLDLIGLKLTPTRVKCALLSIEALKDSLKF